MDGEEFWEVPGLGLGQELLPELSSAQLQGWDLWGEAELQETNPKPSLGEEMGIVSAGAGEGMQG